MGMALRRPGDWRFVMIEVRIVYDGAMFLVVINGEVARAHRSLGGAARHVGWLRRWNDVRFVGVDVAEEMEV